MAGRLELKDVTLAIGEGEFVGLLGANGAGKTTLLRATLGLVPPRAGKVRVLGVEQRRVGHGAVGYMPQARGLPVNLRISGLDFVASALNGERWGLPLWGRGERAELERVLALVDGLEIA